MPAQSQASLCRILFLGLSVAAENACWVFQGRREALNAAFHLSFDQLTNYRVRPLYLSPFFTHVSRIDAHQGSVRFAHRRHAAGYGALGPRWWRNTCSSYLAWISTTHPSTRHGSCPGTMVKHYCRHAVQRAERLLPLLWCIVQGWPQFTSHDALV